jgi:TRAP-type C4-dicarboxylate transport system substrate-binding protein
MRQRWIHVTAALLFASIGSAFAQDKPAELRFSFWLPPAHPLIPATQAWGESITKASNGTLKVTIFPSEQLGKAFDHYDMARDGIADLTYVNPGYQPGRFPIIGAGELPFLVSNATGGSRAFDEWYRKYAAREMRDVKFCLAHMHDPGALHVKSKISSPDQIKGMKIRPAHATMAAFVASLGGTNVQASAPESRDVLERGVADGITFPWGSILLFKIDSAVKFHMDVPLYATTFVYVMNRDKFNSLSAGQKKVVDDHCTPEWAEKIATPWAKYEAEGRAKLKAMSDHTVYPVSDGELAAWRKAAEPLRARWADNVKKAGGNPETILNELQASLKKHNAAY